jgi:hypothetical protein
MMSFVLKRALPVAAALLFCSTFAKAQGGSCHDPWINQGYNVEFHRAPSGSGTTGECNINLYGAGSWTSQQDLFTRIAHSKDCQDPWIGQIYWNLYNRRPSGNECTVSHYGGGQWSSYVDLANKVQAYQKAISLPSNEYLIDSSGNLVNNQGNIVAAANAYVIGAGAGNVIGAGAGNIIAVQGGNVIGAGAGNLAGQRSVQSVGGKRLIVGTVVR